MSDLYFETEEESGEDESVGYAHIYNHSNEFEYYPLSWAMNDFHIRELASEGFSGIITEWCGSNLLQKRYI